LNKGWKLIKTILGDILFYWQRHAKKFPVKTTILLEVFIGEPPLKINYIFRGMAIKGLTNIC
jgi:hypothetical protein